MPAATTPAFLPVWMVYITVDDLDQAIGRCQELNGKVLRPATAWARVAASA